MKSHLNFGNMSCPGYVIITSLLKTLIFGKFDIADDFFLFNHILLLGKLYIYFQKCKNVLPSLQGFIARTGRVYNIELHIARKKKNHFKKWEKLISVFFR